MSYIRITTPGGLQKDSSGASFSSSIGDLDDKKTTVTDILRFSRASSFVRSFSSRGSGASPFGLMRQQSSTAITRSSDRSPGPATPFGERTPVGAQTPFAAQSSFGNSSFGNGVNATSALGFLSPRQAQQYIAQYGQQELEREAQKRKNMDQNPYVFARKPSFELSNLVWLIIGLLPLFSWIVLTLCFAIDLTTEQFSGTRFTIYDLIWSTFNPEITQGRLVVEVVLNTMSVIFGLLITVIGIILQLAATRFTSVVTQPFFRDARTGMSLSYVVFCNAFLCWTYLSMGNDYWPRTSVVMGMVMVTSHLALLFPFLAYLFWFMDPEKVVMKIMTNGLEAAAESINDRSGRDTDKHQGKATLAIEHLVDAAMNALDRKDKIITAEIVDALCSFAILYGNYKHKMVPYWFVLPDWVRQSPDFLTLSDEAIETITDKKTWIEWKILRQYQLVFTESLKHMKEMCYHIAMNTRRMGDAAGKRGDLHVVDLTIKFFNTYLRAGINMPDVRCVYNVLFQYRQLAEWLIEYGWTLHAENEDEEARIVENEIEQRGLAIARFLRYYSFACWTSKLNFLIEVIAQDLRMICEVAFECDSILHSKLLDIFMTVYDGSEPGLGTEGVRRAQVILATTYLLSNRADLARQIKADFSKESVSSLWALMQSMQNNSNKELWEVSERGTNFTYMTPDQKSELPTFFSMFEGFVENVHKEQTLSEQKKVRKQQTTFDFS
eukprot:TRINITY_DN7166_c0_g1_i1.p1 TRINITY_DN7166_c0_g1~~TRINITY_DN7166_c0_g1_i1.p1  ORF type:complete len:722 (-),score=241.38 TRINITY_DN7166_c0_g1_i1:267-2432(-)